MSTTIIPAETGRYYFVSVLDKDGCKTPQFSFSDKHVISKVEKVRISPIIAIAITTDEDGRPSISDYVAFGNKTGHFLWDAHTWNAFENDKGYTDQHAIPMHILKLICIAISAPPA